MVPGCVADERPLTERSAAAQPPFIRMARKFEGGPMSRWKRKILAAHTLLVLMMIVTDPHQAHRPPDFQDAHLSGVAWVAASI